MHYAAISEMIHLLLLQPYTTMFSAILCMRH